MGSSHWLIICLTHLLFITEQLSPVHSGSHKTINNGPATKVIKHLSFPNFSSFNNPRILEDIKLLGSAKFSSGELQIPDQSQAFDLRHQAGKAIFSSPIRLYDPPTQTPASFQTTFAFQFHNLSSLDYSASGAGNGSGGGGGGSGLTFIIAPDEFTVGRPGPWLAMINDACDEDYKAVAIEFDTRWNPEFGDPNDNHVGIDLGSMVSAKTVNASDVGVFLKDGSAHRAWITYDGSRRWLDIRLGSNDGSYPSKPLFSDSLDISPYLKEYMFVGFSASTGNKTQIHSLLSWNFTSTSQAFLRVPSSETCENKLTVDHTGKMTHTKTPSSFLIFMAVVVLALVVLISLYYSRGRKHDKGNAVVLPEKKQRPRPPNKPRRFTSSELFSATASFSELEILGSDSKGVYYRGKLSNGCQVAVKRFSAQFLNSIGLDKRRLLKEVVAIGKVRHPNLVPIRGWAQDHRETMVVYDFFPNGSLDKWLFGVGVLPWTRRFKVVKDVAECLSFLHSKQLAHKNLKTTSVFLDVSFRAVLGDFGFVLCGTESRRFESAVSQSVDVFEFGLLVLEVVAGRRRSEAAATAEVEDEERDLLRWAWRLHESGEKEKLVDKRMGFVIHSEQANRVLEIGLLCTLNESKGRPTMEEVVEFLGMERPIPELPLSRPVSLFPYSSMNVGLCSIGYSCAPFK
ncbi:L-type lectin-domain containing receptor kinase VIII.2-like [Humulus lupulus]|uniref:L-type lectin-domain containing receptor kinase VIII.2-like n=1 Tax=Humulus lupulus TaxID=3486 RepID=UPI002B40A649|nr:L-type lectin-domain containing receptor kinase VIII.2-like [Humulus lupulus]